MQRTTNNLTVINKEAPSDSITSTPPTKVAVTNVPDNALSKATDTTTLVLARVLDLALSKDTIPATAALLVKEIRRKGFRKAISDDIKRFTKEKKLDSAYWESSHGLQGFQELLSALEEDEDTSPERIEFIKHVFYAGVLGAGDANYYLKVKLLQVARSMSLEEIMLFPVFYSNPGLVLFSDQKYNQMEVLTDLSTRSKLSFNEYTRKALMDLSAKDLIGKASLDGVAGLEFHGEVKTEIGEALWNFLRTYDSQK